MSSIQSSLETVHRWMLEHVPEPPDDPYLRDCLEGPARDDDLARLSSTIGSVPSDLSELLRLHNGLNDVALLLGRWNLLSAEAILDEHGCNIETVEEGDPDPWFRVEWIPFAGDGSGNFLVVDSKTGRVTEAANDGEGWPLHEAPSLQGFLAFAAQEATAGKLRWDGEDERILYDGYEDES